MPENARRMPLDIALAYDTVNQRCDLVFNGTDFALDRTWQTPVLMCLGCDRRAHPDDELPQAVDTLSPAAPFINLKRGWAGDALDQNGELTGSRLWIMSRKKQLESTRQLAISIDKEALSPLWKRLGVALTITVQWLRRGVLVHRVQVGKQTVMVPQVVGL
jgi:phage gp46-like protein